MGSNPTRPTIQLDFLTFHPIKDIMPRVTCDNSPGSVGLTKGNIKPLTFYEMRGLLYLAYAWEDRDGDNWLKSICFDPGYGTIHALAQECSSTKVRIVQDCKVYINYELSDGFP